MVTRRSEEESFRLQSPFGALRSTFGPASSPIASFSRIWGAFGSEEGHVPVVDGSGTRDVGAYPGRRPWDQAFQEDGL